MSYTGKKHIPHFSDDNINDWTRQFCPEMTTGFTNACSSKELMPTFLPKWQSSMKTIQNWFRANPNAGRWIGSTLLMATGAFVAGGLGLLAGGTIIALCTFAGKDQKTK
jgi:hypothetical protein